MGILTIVYKNEDPHLLDLIELLTKYNISEVIEFCVYFNNKYYIIQLNTTEKNYYLDGILKELEFGSIAFCDLIV